MGSTLEEEAQLGKNDELPISGNTVLLVAERPGQINPRPAKSCLHLGISMVLRTKLLRRCDSASLSNGLVCDSPEK